jgi:uncharacterized protein GlcG (DUF336 family)
VVAVVDDGGWVILLKRMDHAALTAGVELAPGKARAGLITSWRLPKTSIGSREPRRCPNGGPEKGVGHESP